MSTIKWGSVYDVNAQYYQIPDKVVATIGGSYVQCVAWSVLLIRYLLERRANGSAIMRQPSAGFAQAGAAHLFNGTVGTAALPANSSSVGAIAGGTTSPVETGSVVSSTAVASASGGGSSGAGGGGLSSGSLTGIIVGAVVVVVLNIIGYWRWRGYVNRKNRIRKFNPRNPLAADERSNAPVSNLDHQSTLSGGGGFEIGRWLNRFSESHSSDHEIQPEHGGPERQAHLTAEMVQEVARTSYS